MILKLDAISKTIGQKKILTDITCMYEESKISAIIGAENAGKSSILKIISGRIKPDIGSVSWDPSLVKKNILSLVSYFSEGSLLPGFLTGLNLKNLLAESYPDFRVDPFLLYAGMVKLDLTKKVGSLSRQNQELLKMVLCLSRDTRLFLLDNPFLFLDTFGTDQLIQIIYRKIQSHNSIVITARDPGILETVCDDFLLLAEGKCLFYGNGEDFRMHQNQSVSAFYKKAISL